MQRKNRAFQKKIYCTIFVVLTSQVCMAEDDNKSVAAAKAATAAASQLVSDFSTASFSGVGPFLSYRLGNKGQTKSQSAGDDNSDFTTTSFSITPTVATIDNRIEPMLVDGHVSLVIFGVESFDEIDLIAKGISLTLDKTAVTSTQRQSTAADVSATVTGNGFTIAPYYVMQLESGRLVDFNFGLGKNKLATKSSGITADVASNRAFASVGTSTVDPLGDASYVQYKASLGYTFDSVPSYIQSDGSQINRSTTKLLQAKVGATYTKQLDGISPFIGLTMAGNSFKASGGSSVKPKEHNATMLFITGFNFSSEAFYGTLSVQAERDKTSFLIYTGLRF